MEGYYNVSGSHDVFDDFDIEGKIAYDEVERKQNDSKPKNQKSSHPTEEDQDKNRLLNMKVDLDNGGVGYVFTVSGSQWKCHVCDMIFMGVKNLLFHERSMNHSALMQVSKHHASQFSRMEMKDSEPGPPGVDEDDEEVDSPVLTNIQSTLDDFKSTPLIGLEYVVELNEDYEKESAYVCMLCDKKGDPRTVMAHLVSYNHRLKYLERHFPITYNAINSLPKTAGARRGLAEIVLRISSEMEEKYGRLRPVATDGRHFEENRFNLMCSINKSKHFVETPDKTFVHLVDRELLIAPPPTKTDEIPIPEGSPPSKITPKPKEGQEDDDEIEFQGAFIKGTRVPATRQLRVRKFSVELDDKNVGGSNEKRDKLKKEEDAKSQCSLSSISSASSSPIESRSRKRRNSYSRSRSRSRSNSRRRRRRSRSRSRGRYRRTRSRSRSRRRSHSTSRRSRSPYSSRRRRSPRSRRADSKSREDEKKRSKDRVDDLSQEKVKWERFREEVAVVEKELLEILTHHEKNPEKHPQYPEEWKLFWNRRYKELQQCGRDPNKHDFKPEWIEFWNRRMRELHEQTLMKRKEEIREKLGLPADEVKPHYNRRKKFMRDLDGPVPSGAPMKARSRSPSPWEDGVLPGSNLNSGKDRERERDRDRDRDRDFLPGQYRPSRPEWRGDRERSHSPPRAITVLRILTALEQQLGSLGPRVNGVLSEAIALEKIQNGNSDILLKDNNVVVLFETVKEKFKGQLLAGIVERNMVQPTRNAIGALSELLFRAPMLLEQLAKSGQSISPVKTQVSALHVEVPPAPSVIHIPAAAVPSVAPELPTAVRPRPDPVTVPGVGAVDKAAIAREIATALIMQGKTNVSEQELEQLVSAVVGMAQAQADSQQTLTTAQFVSSLQGAPQPTPAVSIDTSSQQPSHVSIPAGVATSVNTAASPVVSSTEAKPVSIVVPSTKSSTIASQVMPEVTGLQLLQSAYDADEGKAGITTQSKEKVVSMAVESVDSSNQEATIARPPIISKSPAKTPVVSQPIVSVQSGVQTPQSRDVASYVEELTETDLRLLLQSFKDLPLDEQHGLIRYLKKLEATDPLRVEKLRKYVNLGIGTKPVPPKTMIPPEKLQALAKVGQSGRLSPFSSRQQSRNPTQSEPKRQEGLSLDTDSDDDYSFDDVCKAANKKVSEREAAEAEKRKAAEKEEEKKRLELEEMNRKLQEEKAKAEQTLREMEDRERNQQRIVKEKERLDREAALKVGAANWNPVGNLVPAVPPPNIPPPPVPPPMQGIYNTGAGPVGNFNGGPSYYPTNSFSQYPPQNNYEQQSGYYQGQQSSGMYQQQPTPFPSHAYSGYGSNAMYQQPPPQHPPQNAPPPHQGYPVPQYGNQYHY